MNIPPVTIIRDGVAVDLTDCKIHCNTCKEAIESTEPVRGYVVPHRHEADGDGCSGITVTWPTGEIEVNAVTIERLTEEELNTEHPVGLRKVVEDAIRTKFPDSVVIGPGSGDPNWMIDQLMPLAEAVMLWEREGCAQECDVEAKGVEAAARKMPEGHDGESAAWSRHATLVDLAESIRDRDGSNDLADNAERLAEAEVEIRALREVLSDYPGRSIGETEHNNWCFTRDRVLARGWRARLTLGDHFERMASTWENLRAIDAKHKRGFNLSERPPVKILYHVLEEVAEIVGAHALGDALQCEEEMGDALACLVDYAVATGVDLSRVCERWVTEKAPTVFPEAAGLKDRIDSERHTTKPEPCAYCKKPVADCECPF